MKLIPPNYCPACGKNDITHLESISYKCQACGIVFSWSVWKVTKGRTRRGEKCNEYIYVGDQKIWAF